MLKSNTPRGRRRLVLAVAVSAAVVSVAGVAASTLVKSPAQVAADTKAPKASVLTAPVVRRVLATTTVLRGTFTAGQTYPVQPTAVAATEGGPAGTTLVVTAVKVAAGQSVHSGQVLGEVSGRPVFALPGRIPVYRDMLPGESGSDIGQLQDALHQAGLTTGGDRHGYFGPGTKAAVGRWYRRLGYEPPVTGDTTAQAVQAAQQAVDQQRQVVEQLRAGGTAADPAPSSASSARSTSGSTGAPTGSSSSQLRSAQHELTQDEAALAKAQAKDGIELPSSEVVFLPSFPARVDSVGAKVGDRLTGPLLSLVAGGLDLTGRLQPADAPLVKPGMKVVVLDEATGVQLRGRVGSVGKLVTPSASGASQAAGTGTTQPYVPVTVDPDRPWSPDLVGEDVRITVIASATSGEVLAVPAAAVSTDVAGATSVTVLGPGGARRPVRVVAGVTADNYVQVTPQGAALNAGDQVVVGK